MKEGKEAGLENQAGQPVVSPSETSSPEGDLNERELDEVAGGFFGKLVRVAKKVPKPPIVITAAPPK